jgi:hypothetical protein
VRFTGVLLLKAFRIARRPCRRWRELVGDVLVEGLERLGIGFLSHSEQSCPGWRRLFPLASTDASNRGDVALPSVEVAGALLDERRKLTEQAATFARPPEERPDCTGSNLSEHELDSELAANLQ